MTRDLPIASCCTPNYITYQKGSLKISKQDICIDAQLMHNFKHKAHCHIHATNTFTSADAGPAGALTIADISADTVTVQPSVPQQMQQPILQQIQPFHFTSQHQPDQPMQRRRTSHLTSPDQTNLTLFHRLMTQWSKITRKICVKKLINKCGCLKHHALFNRKPMQFLILVYRLVFNTIPAALFWMHCNSSGLNLERLLESELQ